VILLELGNVPQNLNQEFKIEFESRYSGLVGPPRILCIKLNVLPIEQLIETTDFSGWSSRGLPDQQLNLEKSGIVYSSSSQEYSKHHKGIGSDIEILEGVPNVQFGQEAWHLTKDLSACGPMDTVFLFDPIIGQIRFGNGINGKIPPAELSPTVTYQVTEGSAGNIPAGLKWKAQGIGDYGTNQDPTNGGSAALDLAELRRLARVSVRNSAAIVTSTDLEQAAYALPDLRVARAEALPLPDLGEHCSVLAGTRTLVALRARSPAATTTESPRWLAEVQRQLIPRLLLGERLRVVAPDYLQLQIQATLSARSGYDPKAIEEQVLQMLEKLFILVPVVTGDVVWPLGRAVELLDIKARLRNVDGVAGVKDCALIWGKLTSTNEQPKFSSRFLPLWQNTQSRIVVERSAMEASS
jgi:predicted phage baseplate assembly protein